VLMLAVAEYSMIGLRSWVKYRAKP
jgi:hypothetical protein